MVVIRSFADKETRKLFEGKHSKAVPADVRERAESKLAMLDAALSVRDLAILRGTRLEALKGDREGQYSIRINRAYRVCFRFDEEHGDAYDVEITKHYGD